MGCSFEQDDSIKPNQYIEHAINFSPQQCHITLTSILRVTVTNFNVCIETRPSAVAYTVAARTEQLQVETDMPDLPSVTMLSHNHLSHCRDTSLPDVFKLVFEKNPLSTPT